MCYMILYRSNMIKSTVPWSKWRADLPWSIFMACFTMLRPRFLAQRVCHGAGESMGSPVYACWKFSGPKLFGHMLLGRLMFRQGHIIVLAVYRSYICIYFKKKKNVSYVFKYVYIYICMYVCIICIYIYISYIFVYMYTYFNPIIYNYIYIIYMYKYIYIYSKLG